MTAGNSKEMSLRALLPKNINDSRVCFTFVGYKVDGGPDIVTCNSNGYLYEIKNRNIIRCLNLHDTARSVSCHYLSENEKIIIFYLVFTSSNNLLVIRRMNKHLRVMKTFDGVRDFEVYDFECLGFPQIKISFTGEWGNGIYKFPVELSAIETCNESESTMAESLAQELQILNKHIDDLTEEYNLLKKICDPPVDLGMALVGSVTFSSPLNETTQKKLMVSDKWCRVYGLSLILGMKLCNISSETLQDLKVIINHEKIKGYSYSFFRSSSDITSYYLEPRNGLRSLSPGEKIWAVGAFRVPAFFDESELTVSCNVTSCDSTDFLVREGFVVNIWDIASKSSAGLEERFTAEDLMAVMTVKSETRVRIKTDDLEEGLLESIMIKNLGFTKIRHLKDKLFYCTSTYLNEVFVALQHVSANPAVWMMLMYTSDSSQIYFLVNALYDLLPENTAISHEEDEG